MKALVAFVSGAIFALGLGLGGMTQPAKVLAFLDVGGRWDPSLAFVMGGAIAVHALVVRFARRRATPLLEDRFHLATTTAIDASVRVSMRVPPTDRRCRRAARPRVSYRPRT